MDEGAVFDLDVMIGNGRGYVSSENNKNKYEDIDFIAVDSIFSPVKKVNFNVDATRVGQSIDYDKLTLEVTTNGTTSAREIVSLAGKIINEHVNLFIELCSQIGDMSILVSKEEDKQVKLMELRHLCHNIFISGNTSCDEICDFTDFVWPNNLENDRNRSQNKCYNHPAPIFFAISQKFSHGLFESPIFSFLRISHIDWRHFTIPPLTIETTLFLDKLGSFSKVLHECPYLPFLRCPKRLFCQHL